MTEFLAHFNYIAAVILILIGTFAMISVKNLVHKIIGMVLLQMGVILYFVSVAAKEKAKIPIIPEALRHDHGSLDVSQFANPLPHALMLTAIVVGVATLGVALVLVIALYRSYQTLEENEILEKAGKNK